MKKIVRDMILNIIFILAGIAIALLVPSQIPNVKTNVQMGPDFFPYFAAGLMVFVNVIALIVNYTQHGRCKQKGQPEGYVQKTDPKDQTRVFLILAIIAVYIFLMPIIGYVISTLIMVNGLLFLLGARKWYHYLLVSGFSLVIYYVFNTVLYVMLP